MKTNLINFGGILKEMRRNEGISQAELASRIGRTQQAVNRWEYGHALPRPKTLNELMRQLPGLRQALGIEEEEEAASLKDIAFERKDSRFLRANPFLAGQLHDRTTTAALVLDNLVVRHPLVDEKPFSTELNKVIEKKVGNAVAALSELEVLFDSLKRECTI